MQLFIIWCVLCEVMHVAMSNLGTLRTFQAAACDLDTIQLRCPAGTRIAVEFARYGRIGNQQHVCPNKINKTNTNNLKQNTQPTQTTCLLPTAQQTIVGLCQTKTECQFITNSSVFNGDPCPGQRKYVEVAYKCRPYEFRSRLACHDERMRLSCNSNSRIAIFTAIFGRGKDDKTSCVKIQAIQGQTENQQESCFSSYATQTAMQICHGRRTCDLMANALTFGQPCKGNHVSLKVIYTCVPKKVLNKQYEARVVEFTDVQMAPVDKNSPHTKNDIRVGNGPDQVYLKPPTTSTSVMLQKDTAAILDSNCTNVTAANEENKVIGFISQWINTYTYVAQNQERFYLYLILSLGAGVLVCMTLLVVYLLVQRGRARREAKYRTTSYGGGGSILPHGFADDISVVDADIDLDLPVVPMRPFCTSDSIGNAMSGVNSTTASAPCELLWQRGCHTLPRDMPRSLNAGGGANSSFFYG